MSSTPSQTLALFEDDYLLRELGQVAHVPQVALTELVANAWDAGASKMEWILPAEVSGTLTVTGDGHGMTPAQFKKRWMTLRHDREKHQGTNVEFPAGRTAHPRRLYGRNGVGRHGLLRFADEDAVQTFELTRKEVTKTDSYVQDTKLSGAMSGAPHICAWGVGERIAAGVEKDKKLGNPEYGCVRVTTFSALVDTANARLLNLRSVLATLYEGIATDQLLSRVLSRPVQADMAFSGTEPGTTLGKSDG